MTTREFGPFFVILNEDGSLCCAGAHQDSDPYVFKRMGPHDNQTPRKRRVVQAMIVVHDPLDFGAQSS